MERMNKGKESGTLLGVGTAYLPVKEVKGEFYVKVSDFTRCMDSMRKELEEENKKLKKYYDRDKEELMESCYSLARENDELKEKIEHLEFDINAWKKLNAVWEKKEQKLQVEIGGLMGERDGLQIVVEKLKEENQYREDIADVLPEGEGHIAEETIQDLQKEIKLLKMSLEEKDENCYGLAKENKELKEKVETLELWLDNKEKLNEEYRKQIDKLRTDNIYEEGLYN